METTLSNLPKTGHVHINVNVSADMNFSAVAARKLAGRYAAEEISMFLRADDPTLVVSERLYWRVPLSLHLAQPKPLGIVGEIDVDVETGHLKITPALIEDFKRHAEDLVARATPSPD